MSLFLTWCALSVPAALVVARFLQVADHGER